MSKTKQILVFCFLFCLTLGIALAGLDSVAEAAYGTEKLGTILPTGNINDFVVRIINAVTVVLGVIMVAMLVYGGAMYLTSAGNQERVESGKKAITYAVIGIAIVAAARIIAEFVIGAVTGK